MCSDDLPLSILRRKRGRNVTTVQGVFLVSVLGGATSLIAAIGVARSHWRPDVAPFGRQANAFKVLARPESYAVASVLGVIRGLTTFGYGLLGIAVFCLAYQFLKDLAGY
jgi:hypothetical protein